MSLITEEELKTVKGDLYSQSEETARKFHPIFEKMGWTWSGRGVPDEFDIMCTINSLIRDLYHGSSHALTATGRIQVRLVKYNTGNIEARIELVADSNWTNYSPRKFQSL